MDLAKHEQNSELQLECAWRITDWSAEHSLIQSLICKSETPYLPLLATSTTNSTNATAITTTNPRIKMFEAFLTLTQLPENAEKKNDLMKLCDEGIQLALRSWMSLPLNLSNAHLHLLHTFQQFVEIQEAARIYVGVGGQHMHNRLQIVSELKGTCTHLNG